MMNKKLEQIIDRLSYREFSKEEFIKEAFKEGVEVQQASLYFNKRVMNGLIIAGSQGRYQTPNKYFEY